MSEGENRETHNVETVPQTGTHVVDEKGVRPRHGGSAPGRLVPAMTGPEQHADISGGDPDVVRSSDSLAESQARLNGPSGSPNSPPGRVPTWKALVDTVLRWGGPTWDPRSRQALDALANLANRADTLEREVQRLGALHLDRTKTTHSDLTSLIERADTLERERDEARAEADRLREALVQTGCVGDHYCPGNEGFLGDMYGDGYDPEKWPLCARCAAVAGPQDEERALGKDTA